MTRRFGKLPCATFTKVTLPLSTFIVHRETELTAEVPEITQSIVHHVQTSLGRAPYNLDDFGAYQAAALSVRDNLIVSPWSHYCRIASRDRGLNLSRSPITCLHPSCFCSYTDPVVSLKAFLDAFEADMPKPR